MFVSFFSDPPSVTLHTMLAATTAKRNATIVPWKPIATLARIASAPTARLTPIVPLAKSAVTESALPAVVMLFADLVPLKVVMV